MLLELSEVFVCPRCRPAQGLVVMVDRLEERRVMTGALGCPGCDLRVPIREGTIRFERARSSGEPDGGGPGSSPGEPSEREDRRGSSTEEREEPPPLLHTGDRDEDAVRLAALLGADRAEGYLLLGPGLGAMAAGVAARAPDGEVLALEGGGEDPAEGVARATGMDLHRLPIITGRMAGAALIAPSAPVLEEATRTLREGARLAILEPGPELQGTMEELPVRTVAREDRAMVAVRQPGGFDAPFARFPAGPRPRPDDEAGGGDDGSVPD